MSVIIPVYNAEEYLDKCIKSVISQTYKNLEIILINDGSTDGSLELCNFYALSESNVKVLSQQNAGASSARNLGLAHSTGDYIVFVDSDDWIMPAYVESLYFNLVNYSADMVIIDYFIEENTKLLYSKKKGSINIYTNKETLNHIFDTDKFLGYIWNKIFQARIIKNSNMMFNTELKVWEDLLFCCQYISRIEKIVYIQKPLYVYKLRNDSLTKSTCYEVQKSLLKSVEKIMELSKNSSSEFSKQTSKAYANACIDRILMEFRNREYTANSIQEKLSSARPYLGYLSVKNRMKYLCIKTMPKTLFILITYRPLGRTLK